MPDLASAPMAGRVLMAGTVTMTGKVTMAGNIPMHKFSGDRVRLGACGGAVVGAGMVSSKFDPAACIEATGDRHLFCWLTLVAFCFGTGTPPSIALFRRIDFSRARLPVFGSMGIGAMPAFIRSQAMSFGSGRSASTCENPVPEGGNTLMPAMVPVREAPT